MRRTRRWSAGGAAVVALALGWSLGIAPLVEAGTASAAKPGSDAAADQDVAARRAATAGGAKDVARLARFHRQSLDWHGCQRAPDDEEGAALDEAGAQCADVTVPLDYGHPGGRTITVAISRLKASDSAHRIGPLLINLGGPGNPALDIVAGSREVMGEAGPRFDLIGMDVRFTGRSSPLDCDWPASWISRSAGAGRHGFDRSVRLARDLAGRCARKHRDALPYAGSLSIARDMDVIRAALGEEKLSYLGYSQGSYLGALYTQLFPSRAGRMVLDSAINPNTPGTLVLRTSAPRREAALREWAGWASRHDDEYHLGATAPAVLSTVKRVYEAASRHPLTVGRFQVDDTIVPTLLLHGLTDDTDAPELAETLRLLVRAADAETDADADAVEPTPGLEAELVGILTGANSAVRSPQTAIMCADAAVPHDPERYWRDIQAHRADEPLFGPIARNITPCAFWPGHAPKPIPVHHDAPTLIVHADGDIDASPAHNQAMHQALTGSRLLTLEGVRTHGVYALVGSACVDDTVNAYLLTGTLPDRDLTCSRDGAAQGG